MRLRVLVVFLVFAAAYAFAPPWPDDWDGVGFVDAVTRFDMDHFSPHAPGYPVYVALTKLVALFTGPHGAATLVSMYAGAAAAFFAGDIAARVHSERAGLMATLFVALVPLSFRATSGVGTEACALAFASAAAWILEKKATKQYVEYTCVVCALGLGVRLSWAPLYVAIAALALADIAKDKNKLTRAALALAIGGLAWAVPLAIVVGPSHLVALAKTQAIGHATKWGGTAITDGDAGSRLAFFARDLFVDGLGASLDSLGLVIAGCAVALGAYGFFAWRAAHFRGARLALALALPYAAWILVGQNLREAPRHALPLVAFLAFALGLSAETSRRARLLGFALLALITARTAEDAYARRTIPPAPVQLLDLATKIAHDDHQRVVVFGQTSTRFFEGSEIPTHLAVIFGDVSYALEGDVRADRVLVTDEVMELDGAKVPLVELSKLCRPARIDRRHPCLRVYDARFPFLAGVRGAR